MWLFDIQRVPYASSTESPSKPPRLLRRRRGFGVERLWFSFARQRKLGF
jgi:hypothetical protein